MWKYWGKRLRLTFVCAALVLTFVLVLTGGALSATAAPIPASALSNSSNMQRTSSDVLVPNALVLTTADTLTYTLWLPIVLNGWPPIPHQPTLFPIDDPDGDGNYTINWAELPSRFADAYTVQEASDANFTDGLGTACTTSQQSCIVAGRLAGTYYYRVQGANAWGSSPYSNVEMVAVLPPSTPTLYTIDNADGDGNFTVSWSGAARATGYALQEATDSSFEQKTTVYQGAGLSWPASGKSSGTYYYRVLASGPTGQSDWSNTQSVTVPAPSPIVRVLSSNAFTPYMGSTSLYIVGEVRNDTGSNVNDVEISATLRDGSGNVVDSDYFWSMIEILTPGMTSPFRIIFSEPPAWVSYDLQVTWDTTTSHHPYALEVLNSTSYFDSYDEFHVVGEVRNQYAELRNYVRAFVTMYDAQGQVIGADSSYTNPNELSPGQTASFDAGVYFWKHKPDQSKLASYRLQVYDDFPYSREARSIPERR
ncbi:MAG: FxLYD domain-containing protein [Anaerolineae bacterium]|nr:FxLYD domain-containing protein [Anaerolineae bacterium]